MFARIGRFSYRHRRLVVVVWLVLFVFGLVGARRLPAQLHGGGFSNPGAPSQRALALMQQRLHTGQATVSIVFTSATLDARGAEFQQAQAEALSGITPQTVPGLTTVRTYASTGDEHLVARDGKAALAVLVFSVPNEQVQPYVGDIQKALKPTWLTAYITGEPAIYKAITQVSERDLRTAEAYALPFALIVLVLVFGSVVGATLPVIGGGVAVAVTLGLLSLLAPHYAMSIFVMNTASLLGLAVGIDYALFIVGRFREELAAGGDVAAAVVKTVATAGRAIFFSGIAVLVGLLGLLLFPYMWLRSMAVGGSLVVMMSVLAALTLLPAVLGMLGARVNALRIYGRKGGESRFWRAWSTWVMRHPWLVIAGTVAVILVFSAPLTHITVNVPTAETLPVSEQARQGFDLIKRRFDYGALNPIEVLVTWPATPAAPPQPGQIAEDPSDPLAPTRLADLYAYGRELRMLPGVTGVTSVATLPGVAHLRRLQAFWAGVEAGASPRMLQTLTPRQIAAGTALAKQTTAPGIVLFQVATSADSTSPLAQDLSQQIAALPSPAGTTVHVTGLAAGLHDFISGLFARFPWVILTVFAVTYVVLLVLLRSVVLPLKAVIVNSLSILASFGAVAFIFQEGHFHSLLGFTPVGYVDATLPVIMFCTLFGVSMDYEVFLLTRMREAWLETHDNETAVTFGLIRTGRIITGAALIIVTVAGAFTFTSITITKAMGIGLAVAIALDATIVRILLVPAAMKLLGGINWWLPRRLDRLLPGVGGE